MLNPVQSLLDYLHASREEFAKVSWPSRQDTLRYSGLVVAISIVVAAFFAGLDFMLSHTVQVILARHLPAASPQTAPDQNQFQVTPTVQSVTGGPATIQVTPAPNVPLHTNPTPKL